MKYKIEIKRDGALVDTVRGDTIHNANIKAQKWIHSKHCYSADWATKHEGYSFHLEAEESDNVQNV